MIHINLITRLFPVLLAVGLQVMPLVKNLFINPATGANMAFILRWGVGSTAVLGACDAYSGASTPYFQPFQTNITLTVGTFYTNNIIVTNVGSDPGAYFELTNSAGLDSGQLGHGQTTTVCLPAGLTLKCFDIAPTKKHIYAAIYGTPSAVMPTTRVNVDAGFSGAGDIYTNIFFTVSIGSSRPGITNQPASRTNLIGTSASFSVTAGPAPLKYQWYFNTNTALLNATNTTLSLTNVQLANAGTYTVIITNSAGAVTSTPALLTIWQPPIITNQPVGMTNVAGSPVGFSVVVGGTAPLKYQWLFNTNTALLNATNATLSLTNARLSQAGTYSVIITNVAGAITSSPARLGITLPASPTMTSLTTATGGGAFQFTFIPVIGLTNTVQTNSALSGGVWAALTNVPPPPTASPVTVKDPFGSANRFYRVVIQP